MVNILVLSCFTNINNDGMNIIPNFDDGGILSPSEKNVNCSLDMVKQEIESERLWLKPTRQNFWNSGLKVGNSLGTPIVMVSHCIFCINAIIQYVFFCIFGLFHLVMFSRFIDVGSFLSNKTPHFLIYALIGWHLDWFHFWLLQVMMLHILMSKFLCRHMWSSILPVNLVVKLQGLKVTLCWIAWGTARLLLWPWECWGVQTLCVIFSLGYILVMGFKKENHRI